MAAVPSPAAPLPPDHAAALVVGLLDDAAVVPPGDAAMGDAVRAHRQHRRASYGLVVGPFLSPVSQMSDLLDALDADPAIDPLDLVLVADTGLVEAAEARVILLDDDRVELVGLEVTLPPDGPLGESADLTLHSLDFALPTAIEIPRAPGWRDALAVIAEDGAERVSFRAGGPTAAAHPTDDELAERIVAAVRAGAAFKLTAGPHHPLRRTDPETGFEEHGFLNALAATARAVAGDDEGAVAAVLAERDAAALLPVLAQCDPRAVRARFTSFGSGSVEEPVAALRALGMLEDEDS